MRKLFSVLFFVFASFHAVAEEPQALIKTAADQLLSEILSNKEKVDSDTGYLANLIEKNLIPVVDQQYMAKLAMGKSWKQANDQQKQDFMEGFRKLLIKTYAGAFRAYNGQEVTYGETRFSKDKRKAKVMSAIVQPGGKSIDIEYRLLKGTTGDWKVVDAKVAGLALLKTYRTQFAEQFQRDGLDKTIAELKSTEL